MVGFIYCSPAGEAMLPTAVHLKQGSCPVRRSGPPSGLERTPVQVCLVRLGTATESASLPGREHVAQPSSCP